MAKVFRTGNSLAVTIPCDFAQSVGIKPGDQVKVEVCQEKGKVIYKFSGARQLPLSAEIIKKRRRS